MIIDANTKIAALLKQHPGALDAIIGISPKFEKLRNPVLRKLMAGRTSIAMASRIGGCTEADFYKALAPLGFESRESVTPVKEEKAPLPDFFRSLTPEKIAVLDVRSIIEQGEDPLRDITALARKTKQGEAFKVINTFEPTPLLSLLAKQGFASYVDTINNSLVETYFYKESAGAKVAAAQSEQDGKWESTLEKFAGRCVQIDVRDLPMPQPMMTILAALETLPDNQALFVNHKKVPVFLLPELKDRKYDFRIHEIQEGLVQLLIFKE